MRCPVVSCVFSAILVSAAPMALASGNQGPHWSYEGKDGPENWAALDRSFHVCEDGKEQSPVNVKATAAEVLPQIKFKYGTIPTEMLNNGHTIQVNVPEGHAMIIEDRRYQLVQLHFHTPSEYLIENKEFPLEIHFVHKDDTGGLAVVGVMVQEGPVNTELEDIFWNAPADAGTHKVVQNIEIDLDKLLPKQKTYYRFMGSLTTPPCSEGVRWHIMTTPITASAAQIAKFRQRFPYNARPIQSLNNRVVVKDIQ